MRRFRKKGLQQSMVSRLPLTKIHHFSTRHFTRSLAVLGYICCRILYRQALPNRRIPKQRSTTSFGFLTLKDLTASYEADLKASQKAGLGPVAQRLLQKKKAEVKPRRILRRYPGEKYFPTDRFGAGCERRPQSPLHARDERQPYS
jgi:hypothetical protein